MGIKNLTLTLTLIALFCPQQPINAMWWTCSLIQSLTPAWTSQKKQSEYQRHIDAMHNACYLGKYDAIEELVQGNPELANARSAAGHTPLFSAVTSLYHNNPAIVTLLVSLEADIDEVDIHTHKTPLAAAISNEWCLVDNIIAKTLIDLGAQVNLGDNNSPLYCAINNDDAQAARLLIEAGATVEDSILQNIDRYVNPEKQPASEELVSVVTNADTLYAQAQKRRALSWPDNLRAKLDEGQLAAVILDTNETTVSAFLDTFQERLESDLPDNVYDYIANKHRSLAKTPLIEQFAAIDLMLNNRGLLSLHAGAALSNMRRMLPTDSLVIFEGFVQTDVGQEIFDQLF